LILLVGVIGCVCTALVKLCNEGGHCSGSNKGYSG
jgi:hypothetical protein